MRVVMGGANCHLHQLIIHGKEYGRGFSLESSERISKILASLELQSGNARVEWGILILSIQHVPKLPYERRHRILLPSLEQNSERIGGEKAGGSGFDLRL